MAALALVTEETSPPRRRSPRSVREAAGQGERSLLVKMRDTVAQKIDDGVPAHALAPLMRQLREIDKEIRAMDAAVEEEAAGGGVVADEAFDASAV